MKRTGFLKLPWLNKNQRIIYRRKRLTYNPLSWVVFVWENIGRSSYRFIFFIFLLCLKIVIKIVKVFIFLGKQVVYATPPKIELPEPPKISIRVPKLFLKVPLPKFPKLRLRKRYYFLFSALFLFSLLPLSFYFFIIKDLPNPNELVTREQVVSTKIYDRNAKLLYKIYRNQNRTLIPLEEIPDHLIKATIAIEDQNFWQHPGFSIKGIVRAFNRNVNHNAASDLDYPKEKIEGGSTITQQLVKNALLSPEKTIIRKVKEVLLAIQVELIFDKKDILQMYFNEIPYGGTAYGAEEAAQTYFGKSARDLSLAESALLAGLPQAPTKFSPFGANPKLAIARQHMVLDSMVYLGFISYTDAQNTKRENLNFAPQRIDIKSPHFVMYVKDLLVEKYGTRLVEEGGLEVITSLDLDIQQMAEKKVSEEIEKLQNLRVGNGAALITNPKTGEVLAMVGSKDYFNQKEDGNVNVTIRPRQPGSSIKPVNYAYALSNGWTPASIIDDSPVAFRTPGSPPYAPVNYDSRFRGRLTLRSALANSYNVPAVKVLASYGVNKMITMGKRMGISTWNEPERYGLSLTLGGAEVKMTDMAVVYGTLANQGLRVDLHPILRVTNWQGKTLQDFACAKDFNLFKPAEAAYETLNCNKTPVINSNVAYQLTNILSDNSARTPAFGPNSKLNIPGHQVAVKTGTTNNKRDNWTIGYTNNLLVAVWVGNNDNSPMSAVASGVTGASPIWHNIISELLKNRLPHQFIKPSSLVPVEVCSLNGLLPCEGCPTKTEYFLPGTEPKVHCDMKQVKKEKEERDKIPQDTSTTN